MKGLQIRDASSSDAKQLSEIGKATFRENFGMNFHDQEKFEAYLAASFSEEKLKNSIAKAENHYLLACKEEELIAYAKSKLLSKEDEAKLQRLYVKKEFTGNKIGDVLLKQTEEKLARLSAKQLWLLTLDSNLGAQRFYEKKGYKHLGLYPFSVAEQEFNFIKFQKEL